MDTTTVGRQAELVDVASLVEAGRGVLLTGPAGVGKSHLLADVVARRRAAGGPVTTLVGHASTRHVPFGPVAHLLGDGSPTQRWLLLAALRRALVHDAPLSGSVRGGRAMLADDRPAAMVAVDDIDQLDDATLALVVSLAATDDAIVVATCRSEAVSQDRMVGLWKDDLLTRLRVAALDRDDSDDLATLLLEGRVSLALSTRLWEVARGHPLFLRELVQAGRADGAIAHGDEYWDLVAPLAPTGRLVDLVARRLADLDAAARHAMTLVAVAEPIDVATMSQVVGDASMATLERRGMVDVAQEGGRMVAVVSHPLIGEVLRGQLGHFERRAVLEEVIAASPPGRDSTDSLRLATWLVEMGRVPDAGLAVAAARAALGRFEYAAAHDLASTIEHHDCTSLVLLARAQAGLGRTQSAVEHLERAIEVATDDDERLEATSRLIEVLGLVGGDLTRANDRLTAAIAATDDPVRRRELRVRSLVVAGLGGRFKDALTIGEELDSTDLSPLVAAHGLMAHTLAQAMTGQLTDVMARLDRADELAAAVHHGHPQLREQIGLNRVLVLQAAGRMGDSLALVDEVLVAAHDQRMLGSWLFVGAMAAMYVGDLAQAATRTDEAVELLAREDPLGTHGVAASLSAVIAGMRGRPSARQRIELARTGPHGNEVRIRGWLAAAAAWLSGSEGAPEQGAHIARAGGVEAVAGEHHVWGAMVLHVATRLGHPEVVVESFDDVAGEAGPFVALLARHTVAAADRDPHGLAAVAHAFEEVGTTAVAVDAWSDHARALDPADVAGHARAAVRAHELAARCPSYRSLRLSAVSHPLTDRQRQVARHAAAGLGSRRIATQLDIAAKTVDNHLQRVYSVLDVAGRQELAMAFPPSVAAPSQGP